PRLIRQLLQRPLPQPPPAAVAAPGVGGDQQPLGTFIALLAQALPPTADGLHREGRGVRPQTDADPALVSGHGEDPGRGRFAAPLAGEVMHADRLRLALGAPVAATILEVA